jgi:hypothetical protein
MTTLSPPAEPAAFHDAWVAELERLEIDVALAEALLAADAEPGLLAPWEPPSMRGPLPSDLEPRARLVLERQLAVAKLLADRLTATGRHQRYTQAVRDTAHPDVPIYLDLRA